MFEHMLFPTGNTHQARNAIFAFAVELGVLAIATVTMVYYDGLPMKLPATVVPLVLSAPPPPPPPPPAAAFRAPVQLAVSKLAPRIFNVPVPAPSTIPQHAAFLADAAPSLPDLSGGVLGGVPGGVMSGMPGGIPGGTLNGSFGAFTAPAPLAAPKPAATPAVPSAPAQIQVGGEVEAALLVHQVIPLYPVLAMNARLEGTVRMSAIIAVDGRVKNLRVISGNPLLVEAAQDAVKKWVYRPTYLNGVPAEVITEINVQFHLRIPKG
jgi:periplasmic protein TonB